MEQKHIAGGRFRYGNDNRIIIEGWQKHVILLYGIITLFLFADRWLNGLLLSQINPPFFVTRMDVSSWLMMYSGIHTFFINNYTACVVADVLLILLPVLYILFFFSNRFKWAVATAWLILFFNAGYALCYTMYPSNSIEGHIGWMLFPIVLICCKPVDCKLALKFIRYVLMFFFASAGLWKFRNGGIFYMEEMSGILLFQHKEFLITSPDSYFTTFYYWLIQHPYVGYCLYTAGTLIELSFFVGFFTKRFDKILLILFFLFIIFDILIMRIKYWEISYMVIPLFFSRKIMIE